MQRGAVDDQKLGVVTHQIVAGPADRHARREQAVLELPQPLLPSGVGVGNERAHGDASLDSRDQRLLDGLRVDPKDHHVDRLGGGLDGRYHRIESILGKYDSVHTRSSTPAAASHGSGR